MATSFDTTPTDIDVIIHHTPTDAAEWAKYTCNKLSEARYNLTCRIHDATDDTGVNSDVKGAYDVLGSTVHAWLLTPDFVDSGFWNIVKTLQSPRCNDVCMVVLTAVPHGEFVEELRCRHCEHVLNWNILELDGTEASVREMIVRIIARYEALNSGPESLYDTLIPSNRQVNSVTHAFYKDGDMFVVLQRQAEGRVCVKINDATTTLQHNKCAVYSLPNFKQDSDEATTTVTVLQENAVIGTCDVIINDDDDTFGEYNILDNGDSGTIGEPDVIGDGNGGSGVKCDVKTSTSFRTNLQQAQDHLDETITRSVSVSTQVEVDDVPNSSGQMPSEQYFSIDDLFRNEATSRSSCSPFCRSIHERHISDTATQTTDDEDHSPGDLGQIPVVCIEDYSTKTPLDQAEESSAKLEGTTVPTQTGDGEGTWQPREAISTSSSTGFDDVKTGVLASDVRRFTRVDIGRDLELLLKVDRIQELLCDDEDAVSILCHCLKNEADLGKLNNAMTPLVKYMVTLCQPVLPSRDSTEGNENRYDSGVSSISAISRPSVTSATSVSFQESDATETPVYRHRTLESTSSELSECSSCCGEELVLMPDTGRCTTIAITQASVVEPGRRKGMLGRKLPKLSRNKNGNSKKKERPRSNSLPSVCGVDISANESTKVHRRHKSKVKMIDMLGKQKQRLSVRLQYAMEDTDLSGPNLPDRKTRILPR